jgi:hypothetical protein
MSEEKKSLAEQYNDLAKIGTRQDEAIRTILMNIEMRLRKLEKNVKEETKKSPEVPIAVISSNFGIGEQPKGTKVYYKNYKENNDHVI